MIIGNLGIYDYLANNIRSINYATMNTFIMNIELENAFKRQRMVLYHSIWQIDTRDLCAKQWYEIDL